MVPRATSPLRILQIAPRLPWPLDTGAKLRNFHLGRMLSQTSAVTLLALDNQKEGDSLGEFYDAVVSVPRAGHNSVSNLVKSALGKTPLPLRNYTTAEMMREVQALRRAREFDVVQFESIHLMNYLPPVRDGANAPLTVLDWHNIESDLMQQYSERESNPFRKAYARRTAKLMREAEIHAAREFDAHLVVSETDARRLRLLNPNARIIVIENGVDVEHFEEIAAAGKSATPRNRIVFVASMDYHANIDAAISFARDVWPQLRERQTNLVFTIVGRDPAPAVRELGSVAGVEVTGTVDDVRPFYREAVAAIAPLRVGGGSRLKILEAMAAGVPVVATTLGAEGLEVQHDENILIADSDEAIRDAIISVAQDSKRSAKLIDAGFALVKSRYDWSQLGAKLFASYESLVSERRF
jgi:sugar transferase (PEP-CTERM/EpsH1 system associated)